MKLNPETVLVPPVPILVKVFLHHFPLIMGNFLISYTHNTTSIIMFIYIHIYENINY